MTQQTRHMPKNDIHTSVEINAKIMRAHLITKINLYAPTDIVTIQKCQNNANNRYHFGDIQNTNTNTIIKAKK